MTPLRIVCVASLGLMTAGAFGRPVIIQESTTLTAPDPVLTPQFGNLAIATNGEYALISGFKDESLSSGLLDYYALLYRRINGQWTFQRTLTEFHKYYDSYSYPVKFAMKGNQAAIALSGGFGVWELTGAGWTDTGFRSDLTEDLETDGTKVLAGVGEGLWNGRAVERASNGTWTSTFLQGQPRGNDDEFWGGPVDLDGNYAILGTPYTFDLEPQEIPIYRRAAVGQWQLQTKLQVPQDTHRLLGPVALLGDDAIVAGLDGAYYWRFLTSYQPAGRLRSLDAQNVGQEIRIIEKNGGLVFMRERDFDLNVHVINVYRPPASGTGDYEYIAKLVARSGASLGGFDVSGNAVLAGDTTGSAVHVFSLPASFTTPTPRYEDFQTGSGANWTPGAGAQYAVATVGVNRVFRQSSVAGDAHAVLGGPAWGNQAIEADIRPTEFARNDRWVGLATRYTNAQNYYYVTLRNSGSVQVKRMRNGTFSTLASAPLSVTANRTYRVRLESIGETHRVYVDGVRMLDVDDPAGLTQGNVALLAYQTRADFDNVVVSPSPRTTIFANRFVANQPPGAWSLNGTGQWTGNDVFAQSSVAGDARAFIGTPTGDQVVSARVQPVAYAAPQGTQERWSGLFARYTDERNYYYLTLRNSNTISLRKQVNGVITPLASASFASTPGTTYALRLEAVGNQLRAYVNGNLLLQATDSSHASGSGGLVTFKTAANFDDYVAYQP
jgi:hypothetical protein